MLAGTMKGDSAMKKAIEELLEGGTAPSGEETASEESRTLKTLRNTQEAF